MTEEYFSVPHNLTINVEILPQGYILPNEDDFLLEIPVPFTVANEFNTLDPHADHSRFELASREIKSLLNLIEMQNEKLNLLLSFMLSQQEDPNARYVSTRFGASSISFNTSQDDAEHKFAIGTLVRLKIFLHDPACAIYCYATVAQCEHLSTIDDDIDVQQNYHINLKYLLLRDIDQDLLIKAALHKQQKDLRQRSQERDKINKL